jgi:apolipoprotein N-acyltransferase
MATALMPAAQTRGAASTTRADRSIHDIIDEARSALPPARAALRVSVTSALLLWASFTPLDWGPLAWVALVPLTLLVRIERPARRMYRMAFAGGLVFALAALQWMRLGDAWMYPAWVALAAYIALYFPLFVALSRAAVHRYRVPLTLAVPVVWVGLEFLRGHLMSGFAWYFLGHTQHQWTKLIQISDLCGAYGVSFLVALGNACLAGLVPPAGFRRLRLAAAEDMTALQAQPVRAWRRVAPVAVLLVVFVSALAYGYVRRAAARFEAGPRVALIQGNFTSSLKHDPSARDEIYNTHNALTGLAVKHQPEVVVWPETMFRWGLRSTAPGMTDEQLEALHPDLNAEEWHALDNVSRDLLASMSEQAGAALVIGVDSIDAAPGSLKPYNSAVFVRPDAGIADRYDKLHRVPFGEYVPFSDALPWLKNLSPMGPDAGIDAGDRVHVFALNNWRLVPLICFEDTVPHLVRGMLAAAGRTRRVDCLVNLTNDGWFHGSSELDQHLITARFRCIENRTPMIRAVNTGISAIIDGDGIRAGRDELRTTIRNGKTGRLHKSLNCALVGHVPLDNRRSLYQRWGDWFAGACAVACVLLALGVLASRRSTARRPVAA